MKTLSKVNKVLNTIRVVALVAILAAAVGMCATNIVLRYIVRGVPSMRPFPWVDELLRMCAVWVAFLAAGLGVREGSHISLDNLVTKFMPARAAGILKKAAQLIVLAVLLLLIVFGVKQTITMSASSLQNLPVSNGWFYAAIPVGCFYLFYDYLLIFIFGKHPFAKKEEETQDPTATSGAF